MIIHILVMLYGGFIFIQTFTLLLAIIRYLNCPQQSTAILAALLLLVLLQITSILETILYCVYHTSVFYVNA